MLSAICFLPPLERCQAWLAREGSPEGEDRNQGSVQQLRAHLVGSTLATPWPVYWRELTTATLASLPGLGVTHQYDPCTSGIVTTGVVLESTPFSIPLLKAT